MFVAIQTARNDGHRYISQLMTEGVRAFLVSTGFRIPETTARTVFVQADDPLAALQRLAAHHRMRYNIPVIGITGSNGKTVVKEWLYALLKDRYSICRSPRSYNSQLGVPISVLSLGPRHTLAIFEAGISRPGEMEKLGQIIKPTLGILTSLGGAHDEGFVDRTQKLREKLRLFTNAGAVIVNGVKNELLPADKRYTSICDDDSADIRAQFSAGKVTFRLDGVNESFSVPFNDKASLMNAATCIVTLLKLGYRPDKIREKLGALPSLALRLESRRGILGSVLVSDYYNSDLDALAIAVDHMRREARGKRQVVVLSDIEQSGMSDSELYRKVAVLLEKNGVDTLIGIGAHISAFGDHFGVSTKFFPTTEAFVEEFSMHREHFRDAVVLLKGARSFGFERIDRLLQLKTHDTVFEISLARLRHNLAYYRSLTRPGVKQMCMVKATGYGSGGSEIAGTLQHAGVEYLAVAYADEGVELRESRITLPVMVMSPEEAAFDDMLKHMLEPELYSFRILEKFASTVERAGLAEPFPVHIKIDTGMHRLGFIAEEFDQLGSRLRSLNQLRVASVFTHLAATDNPAFDEFTKNQLGLFEEACKALENALGYQFMKHACNSAGITRFPEAHYDMVRVGIGMYGISGDEREQRHLVTAGALKTRVSQVRDLPKDETVGYNRAGKLERPTRIATIPIGYADGFSRQIGQGRHGVYVKGKFCRTIGSICMDMCMIDVTGIECGEGDEVVIFESAEQLKALAGAMQTIPYEVLTGVSARVKRVYVDE
jgi:Alr-MurF fusion protein